MESTSRAQHLKQACGLLEMLPGLLIVSTELMETEATLTLSISDDSSLDQLCLLTTAANVSTQKMSPNGELEQVPSQADTARICLTASTAPRDTVAVGALQLLCIHLVWHLHQVGKLSTQHANSMLDRWSASRVGI